MKKTVLYSYTVLHNASKLSSIITARETLLNLQTAPLIYYKLHL